MKNHNWKKKVMPWLLVLCMAVQMTSTAFASTADQTEEPVWEKVEDETSETAVEAEEVTMPETEYEDEEEVRVMIVMEDDAVVDAGYSTVDIVDNSKAMAYSDKIEKKQNQVVDQISEEVLDGETLDVRYNFTILTNAVAATVKYGEIENIKEVEGVSEVYITPKYEVMETVDTNSITAGTMIGSYNTWEAGYTGAGQRIAVIDTGIDADHPSFDGEAFDYALAETAKEGGTTVDSYHLLDEEEIAEVLPNLNASSMYSGLKADDLFLNDKLAYAFNYVDENLDITHDNDTEGEHGTHVSGIACANRYVPTEEGFEKQKAGVFGVAPEAQLITMKVFGTRGGAYTDDYMAAIEDALLLKADAINLSLGSSSAGNSADSEAYVNEIFDKLQGCDTVVSISAGNAGRWSDSSYYGGNLASDVNLDTVGSPGSYTNAFTVASAVNSGYTGYKADFDGKVESYYDDGSSANNAPFTSLDTSADGNGTSYEYVLFTGCGEKDTYENIDVDGKIVLVRRGAISFAEKHMNAEAAGAAGVLIYNNTSGTIGMNLTGSTATIPCASITLADAEKIKENATCDETTGGYTGSVVVKNQVTTNYNAPDGYTMSDFSSVGVPGSLELKPEITAPGGNIYSTIDNGQYGLKSGTSMAAPSVAGMSALMSQYIKENNLTEKTGLSVRTLSQSLLMSTAIPLTEEDGEEYSPRSQGAGLANVENATTSPVYILMGEKDGNDGKVKAELGDDPERKGVYSFDFSMYNLSDETQYYTADSSILTEEIIEDYFIVGTSHKLNPTVTISSDEQNYLYDLNKDGVVDSKDASALLAHINGKTLSVVEFYQDAFDFNQDGVVNTADAYHFLNEVKADQPTVDFSQKVIAVKNRTDVTVTITLSAEDKAYLDDNFENGMYVDGFIYMKGKVDLSVPLLAFYGNWGDSSMYEPFDFLEAANNGETYPTYSKVDVTNFLTYSYAGSSAKYYYTSNMFSADGDEAYIADRNAFSSTSGDSIASAYYTLIRNASRVVVSVTDAETGEVYLRKEGGEETAAFYYATGGSWENTLANTAIDWKGTDADGKPLADGTKVEITVTAVPAYYDGVALEDLTGKGMNFTVPMTIDNTAPEAELESIDNGTMELTVSDNRYVAAVKLYASDKKTLLGSYDVNQTKAGVESTITTDYPSSVFYVKVLDYAGNYTTYRVNNSGHEDTKYAESITLNQTELSMLKGGTAQLIATVGPEYLLDDSVTWSSSDETVATVDAKGVVTAVGNGNAIITATTVANGTSGSPLKASCEVAVETLEVGLNGIVWDENGGVYWSSFKSSDTSKYEKISEEQSYKYMSAVQVGDKLVAATYDSSQNSDLYLVDPNNGYGATLLSNVTWCTDMAYSPATDLIYATYGPYVQVIDGTNGESQGFLGFSSKLNGEYLVGIAYVGTGLYQGAYPMDVFYAVSQSGALYQMAYVLDKGTMFLPVGNTGVSTNGKWYFNSLYYDAETDYLFWSMYDNSNNVTLYAIKDIYHPEDDTDTVLTYELGKFPDGVWPVSGLYQSGTTSASATAENVVEKVEGTVLEQSTLSDSVPVLNSPVQGK
ncbi:MAG: S8 family serine peptidase [Roseburia sp.]